MIINANDLAREKSHETFKSRAWLEFKVENGELYARGQFSGWSMSDWMQPSFHIPFKTMVELVKASST